jgi:hypothetical protein
MQERFAVIFECRKSSTPCLCKIEQQRTQKSLGKENSSFLGTKENDVNFSILLGESRPRLLQGSRRNRCHDCYDFYLAAGRSVTGQVLISPKTSARKLADPASPTVLSRH